jgi:predicted nucleic acid-binding protein
VSGNVTVTASRDPEDDKFLEAAVEGKARHVVTRDKDWLELKTYRGIESALKPNAVAEPNITAANQHEAKDMAIPSVIQRRVKMHPVENQQ